MSKHGGFIHPGNKPMPEWLRRKRGGLAEGFTGFGSQGWV